METVKALTLQSAKAAEAANAVNSASAADAAVCEDAIQAKTESKTEGETETKTGSETDAMVGVSSVGPLRIAVKDSTGLNPLAIAVARGDFKMAQTILDIATAQHYEVLAPSSRRVFRICGTEYNGCDESDDGNDRMVGGVQVKSDLVDDRFTIEDLDTLCMRVDNTVSTKELLSWPAASWIVSTSPKSHDTHSESHNPTNPPTHTHIPLADAVRRYIPDWKIKCLPTYYYSALPRGKSAIDTALQSTCETAVSLFHAACTDGDAKRARWLMAAAEAVALSESSNSSKLSRPGKELKTSGTKRYIPSAAVTLWGHGNGLPSSLDDCLYLCLDTAETDAEYEGRRAIAEELISKHGVGMPLLQMAAAVEIPEAEREHSQYYQGLKIRGKFKANWAAQASGDYGCHGSMWRGPSDAPLLRALHKGTWTQVKFWLTPECKTWYERFGEEKVKTHRHLELIARANGGWKQTVQKWLGLRRDLALHVLAIRSAADDKPGDERANETPEETKEREAKRDKNLTVMADFLLTSLSEKSASPTAILDKRAVQGYAPLWLAFYFRNVALAKWLIEAGANQTTRDGEGLNILHALLYRALPRASEATQNTVAAQARAALERSGEVQKIVTLLELVDKRLVKSLFLERCSEGVSGMTPVALNTHRTRGDIDVYDAIKRFMPAEALTTFDGSGQTPIHALLVKRFADDSAHCYGQSEAPSELLWKLVEDRPDLLCLENAVGQTPLDLAATVYLRHQSRAAGSPPDSFPDHVRVPVAIVKAKDTGAEADALSDWRVGTYVRLAKVAHAHAHTQGADASVSSPLHSQQTNLGGPLCCTTRKMISVRDAAEVAKRLTERQGFGRGNAVRRDCFAPEVVEGDKATDQNEKPHDEIQRWFCKLQ